MKRRLFIKTLIGLAAGSGAIVPLISHGNVRHVEETDREAKEIGYVKDGSRVSSEEFPFYKEGNVCQNCKFYRPQSDGTVGTCSMYFPDRLVQGKGWCVGWMKSN